MPSVWLHPTSWAGVDEAGVDDMPLDRRDSTHAGDKESEAGLLTENGRWGTRDIVAGASLQSHEARKS